MFKYVIRNLITKGHVIKITINTKDILENLLIADGIQYENILPERRKKNTKLAALITLMRKTFGLLKIQIKGKFDLFVGTESALSHIGWLFRKPVFIMDEDDVAVVPEAALVSFPFASYIVSPDSCNLGKWSKKKISYPGYQKLAYLHPNHFIPKRENIRNLVSENERFFLIRISGLSAYHDTSAKGFTIEMLREIVRMLESFGKVIISTEKKLPADLNQYCSAIDISQIHHYLYFADLLIADSQSMCVEAAVLGTPSLRYSNFAGKIGVLEELEQLYELTYGFPVSKSNALLEKLDNLLKIESIKLLWHQKRDKMLRDKIDVSAFWTWLIDNYPSSVKEWRSQQKKF